MDGTERNQNPDPQPYLNYSEVIEFAGLSRRMVENYTAAGICLPDESGGNGKHWTFGQAALLAAVPALKGAGMSLKDIAEVANGDVHGMPHLVYSQLLDDMRADRRRLKKSVALNRRMSDIERLGPIEGKYLRYIPQRWLALIPARDGELVIPGSRPFVQLVNELRSVAQVVGWCNTDSVGSLSSISVGGAVSSYATVGLASPPMPTATGGMVIDGGCYHVIDPERAEPRCTGGECYLCSRYGRPPTERELGAWAEAAGAHPGLWDRTVMVDELAEPYATGMWSGYTRQKLEARARGAEAPYGHEQGMGGGTGGRGQKPRWRLSVRPRLMPHAVKLPLGVTACVLPAGVYLCCQCDEGHQSPTYHSILGSAETARFRPFTVDDEIAAYEKTREIPAPTHAEGLPGPHVEEFAKPRSPGDPRLAGWSRKISSSDVPGLTVPTGMALSPEDGFCVMCCALPDVERGRPARYEVQLLVDYQIDASEMSTPPPGNRP